MSITSNDIIRDPCKFLLHKKRDTLDRIHPLQGRVGAVMDDGKYFIISPFNIGIPALPPLMLERPIQLHEDLTFGLDDPFVWPQPWEEGTAYLSAIRVKPADGESNSESIWWDPLPADGFTYGADRGSGVSKVSVAFLVRKYFNPYRALHDRAYEYQRLAAEQKVKPVKLIAQLSEFLDVGWSRLSELSMSFDRASLLFTQFQRDYLELQAVLDWMEIYQPRTEGRRLDASGEPDNIMGTILYWDALNDNAERLWHIGVPYWIIYPVDRLPETRVDSFGDVCPFPTRRNTAPTESSPTIGLFAFRDSAKFAAMRSFFSTRLNYSNPFQFEKLSPTCHGTEESASHAGPAVPTTTAIPPKSVHTGVKKRYSKPYEVQRSSGPRFAHTLQTGFLPSLGNPVFPIALTVWHEALEGVLIQGRIRPSRGSVLPDPKIFIDKGKTKVTHFIRYLQWRTFLFSRLSDPNSTAEPLQNQFWRQLLGKDIFQPGKPNSLADSQRVETLRLLGPSHPTRETLLPATWRDEVFTEAHPSPDVVMREILWELGELNFRFELLEMDRQLGKGLGCGEFNQCFRGVDLLDIRDSSPGMASASLQDRAPFLLALCRLMSRWDGGHDFKAAREKHRYRDLCEQDLLSLERKAAKYYTQAHFNIFARSVSIPRRMAE